MTTAYGILIIEDEQYIRESLADYFRDEGYRVIAIERGEDALVALKKESFNVAIVDIRLSGIDGTHTIQHIKQIDPNIAIFVFTGSLEFQITSDLASLGLSEEFVIYKPISDLDQIGEKIRSLGFDPNQAD